MSRNTRFKDLLAYIREHRSNEANFEALYQKLGAADLPGNLGEEGEKLAAEYRSAREISGSAWPQFENFVSHYEKGLTEAEKS